MQQHVYSFEGIDPAPSESHKSDDGALVVAPAQSRRIPEKDEMLSDNPADLRHFERRRIGVSLSAKLAWWRPLLTLL